MRTSYLISHLGNTISWQTISQRHTESPDSKEGIPPVPAAGSLVYVSTHGKKESDREDDAGYEIGIVAVGGWKCIWVVSDTAIASSAGVECCSKGYTARERCHGQWHSGGDT